MEDSARVTVLSGCVINVIVRTLSAVAMGSGLLVLVGLGKVTWDQASPLLVTTMVLMRIGKSDESGGS